MLCFSCIAVGQDTTRHHKALNIELELRSGTSWLSFNDWISSTPPHRSFIMYSFTASMMHTFFVRVYHSNLDYAEINKPYMETIGLLVSRSNYDQTDITLGYEHCFLSFLQPRIGAGLSVRSRDDWYNEGYINQGTWIEGVGHNDSRTDVGINIHGELNFKYYIFTVGGFLTSRLFFAGNPVTLEFGPHAGLILPCYREGWLTPRKRAAIAKAKH